MLRMRFGQAAAILALAGLAALSLTPAAAAPDSPATEASAPETPPGPEPPRSGPQSAPFAPSGDPSPSAAPRSSPARPQSLPARPRPRRPRGEPVRDPRAVEVLRSVLDACGGEEYLRGIQSLFVRARLIRGEGEQQVESLETHYWKAPNRYRWELDSPAGQLVMAYNGRYGWKDEGQGPALARKQEYPIVEDFARDINEPLSHLDEGNWLEYEGEQDLDGRRVDVVRVTRPSGKIKRLFIDRETRQTLQREVAQFEDPGRVVARRRLLDHRRVERIWVPFLERDLLAEVPTRREMLDFIPNQAIDDRLFDSPAPPLEEAPPPPAGKAPSPP